MNCGNESVKSDVEMQVVDGLQQSVNDRTRRRRSKRYAKIMYFPNDSLVLGYGIIHLK